MTNHLTPEIKFELFMLKILICISACLLISLTSTKIFKSSSEITK